jgi:hypothetical protein
VWLELGAILAQMVSATSVQQEPMQLLAQTHALDVTVDRIPSKGLASALLAQPASMFHQAHTCPAT